MSDAVDGIGWRYDLPRFDGRAACAETNPEAFFPDQGGSAREAKKVCAGCEIRQQCLDYGLRWNVAGIWGGESEKQRRRLRDRLGIVAENIAFTEAADRRDTVTRMHARGTPAADIARTLDITQEAVHRILREAS